MKTKAKWKNINKKYRKPFFILGGCLLIVGGLMLIRPVGAQYALSKGDAYFGKNTYELEQAKKWYERAAFFRPSDSKPHYQLARIYFVQEEFQQAEQEINIALELAPENKRSHYIRGLIRGFAGNVKGSQEDFAAFVQWAPNEWAGYNDLAWAYYQDSQYEQAKEIAQQGVEKFPKNAWLLNGLGASLIALGQNEQAEDILSQADQRANGLTPNDWKLSYPSNDPTDAGYQLGQFQMGIAENLDLAKKRGCLLPTMPNLFSKLPVIQRR